MTKFNLIDYDVTLLRLYKKVDEEITRLIEDLEFYMLKTKDKEKYLYFVAANKNDIYIVWDRYKTGWNIEKISLIISNVLKDTTFMHIYISGYNGVMPQSFWEELKSSVEYFKNVKKFRKKLKKADVSEEIITPEKPKISIDDILNKINENGFESLTDEEKQILKENRK